MYMYIYIYIYMNLTGKKKRFLLLPKGLKVVRKYQSSKSIKTKQKSRNFFLSVQGSYSWEHKIFTRIISLIINIFLEFLHMLIVEIRLL